MSHLEATHGQADSIGTVAPGSLLPFPLRWSAPVLAFGYGVGVRLHRAMSKPRYAPIATLCVGNLTAGGTGKTPAVKFIARELAACKRRPAVLMRGYKGQGLDEAREVQTALSALQVPVILGADRWLSAVTARSQGCDVVILDDGLQHWRLARDLDIVLVDATDPFGGERLLPEGRLREYPEALSRAGAIIITRSNAVSGRILSELRNRIAHLAPGVPQALASHKPVRLVGCRTSETAEQSYLAATSDKITNPAHCEIEKLCGMPIIAACGLGNPEAFRRTLLDLGAELLEFLTFPDHHKYTARDLEKLQSRAKFNHATGIIVTGKDMGKLAELSHAIESSIGNVEMENSPTTGSFPSLHPFSNTGLNKNGDVRVWALEIEFEIVEGRDELWKKIMLGLDSGDRRAKMSNS